MGRVADSASCPLSAARTILNVDQSGCRRSNLRSESLPFFLRTQQRSISGAVRPKLWHRLIVKKNGGTLSDR